MSADPMNPKATAEEVAADMVKQQDKSEAERSGNAPPPQATQRPAPAAQRPGQRPPVHNGPPGGQARGTTRPVGAPPADGPDGVIDAVAEMAGELTPTTVEGYLAKFGPPPSPEWVATPAGWQPGPQLRQAMQTSRQTPMSRQDAGFVLDHHDKAATAVGGGAVFGAMVGGPVGAAVGAGVGWLISKLAGKR